MKPRRFATGRSVLALLVFLLPALAKAQGKGGADDLPPEPPAAPAPSDSELKTGDEDLSTKPTAATVKKRRKRKRGEAQRSWEDVVVVPRKPFLKKGRFEISPFYGTTVNDTLIQHSAIGAEANYFLTDILSIGVIGMAYFSNVLEQEFTTRYHFGRVPSLNKYRYTATLNFGYIPIYGKFSLFNDRIFFYDVYVTGGVGITGTEVIPRDYQNESFSNIALTFPVGMGARLFVTKWLAVHVGVRDFMMLDKFEPANRRERSGDKAKGNAETRFINNIVFQLGVSVYLPTSFEYTTFR